VTKGKRKKGSEVEQFDFELDKMTKKDKRNVLELIKRVRRQEDELTRQQAYRDSFEEELKKLKESNDILSRKCKEDITKAYACATKSLSCATSLEKENQALKDQLEEITCKLVKLQGTHKELEYSYEKLVESHTLLEVVNEVMVNSVKSYTPHCTTSTCTQIENDISCANPCGPKGKPSWYDQVIVESCDDFIAQENDDLMQEVEKLKKEVAKLKRKEMVEPSQDNCEPMVKKLEKETIVTRSISQQSHKINDHKISNKKKLDHIKCYKCSHMGHYASMCSFKKEDNPNQSKRQRSLAQRRCFGCHEKGHKIEACTNRAKVPSGKFGGTWFAKPVAPVSTEKPEVKLNKGFLKAQAKYKENDGSMTSMKKISNTKHKICYTCHQKGHLSKDYPNSKDSKLNHVHYQNNMLERNSNDYCASRVVVSQRKGTKAIWVPKSLITNLVGPNAHWVPKHA
jgi:hypothetical protein